MSPIVQRPRKGGLFRRAATAVVAAAMSAAVITVPTAGAEALPAAAPAAETQGTGWDNPLDPPMLSEVLNPFAVAAIRDGVPASFEENVQGLWGAPGPFYDEPVIEDWMPVGHLLKSEPFEVIFNGIKPANIRAWRMMYVTEDVVGRKVISTGIIMLPDDGRVDSERPVIAYQEANDSAGAKCHPSTQWSGGAFAEASSWSAIGPLAQMLGEGAAVMISDIGNDADPGVHGVFAGRYAGMALLNGLRAAYDVPGPELNPDNKVGLFGVAGGGVGAAFAIEYQPWYAPELNIAATMLEALAVDQKNFIDFADGHLGSGFVLATLVGLEAQYPELNLDAHVNPAGQALVNLFRDSCQTYWYFGTPFLPQSWLYNDGIRPADRQEFQHVFEENTLGRNNPNNDPALAPPGKVLVSSCAGDDSFMVVTPAEDSRKLVDIYKAQGADAFYHGLDCSTDVFITDLYKWGTELFGMHTVDWLMSEIR